jgi:1,4-dihydroxy-2-naphthoyl-CoA hydrolase
MSIWTRQPQLAQINEASHSSMAGFLNIEFSDVGADHLSARMPVSARTRQPFGLLHGGASAALAETLGSVAGLFTIDPDTHYVVGLAININHLRAVPEGVVVGTTRPLHLGRTTQVWQIHIRDEEGNLVSASRLTLAVRPHEGNPPRRGVAGGED